MVVSVLFSEPKIPQSATNTPTPTSAVPFQCSSASRKFLNVRCSSRTGSVNRGFSALQRAENSSIGSCRPIRTAIGPRFSALQRAENSSIVQRLRAVYKSTSFSALQRAENSSIRTLDKRRNAVIGFSALQRAENSSIWYALRCARHRTRVSVLFSEPKIPQWASVRPCPASGACFSALQRAENSSMVRNLPQRIFSASVSVLFSEPKIPQ